jgi:hypothetical protein
MVPEAISGWDFAMRLFEMVIGGVGFGGCPPAADTPEGVQLKTVTGSCRLFAAVRMRAALGFGSFLLWGLSTAAAAL